GSRTTTARAMVDGLGSCQSARAAIYPFGSRERDEEQQHGRHVPQVALLDDRDAAAAVADRFGQRGGGFGREEPAAGFLRDPLHERRPHGRVEVLRVAGGGADVDDIRAEILLILRGAHLYRVESLFVWHEAAVVLAVARHG